MSLISDLEFTMNLKAFTSILFSTKKAKFVNFKLFSYSGPKTANIPNIKFAISQEPFKIFSKCKCVELVQSRRKIKKYKKQRKKCLNFFTYCE